MIDMANHLRGMCIRFSRYLLARKTKDKLVYTLIAMNTTKARKNRVPGFTVEQRASVILNSFTTKRTARQSRNPMSEYLPQRRKGAKVFRKIFFSELGVFAPWRENDLTPR
jgi:hypothetical protein